MPILSLKNWDHSSLRYVHQIRVRSQIIYVSVLLAIVFAVVCLPFIYVSVSVNGQGLMQSSIEKIEILAPANGRAIKVNLIDNQKVIKGEELLVLDTELPTQQSNLITKHTVELQNKIDDIAKLTTALQIRENKNPQPITDLYEASWQQFTAQLSQTKNEVSQAERIYQRYETLYRKQAVTQSEFEQYKFNYEQTLSNQDAVIKKFKSQWQLEANQYRNELRELKGQSIQLKDQQKQYILKSTINGSVQNLMGLQTGAYVYANQKIGEISPDSALIAYCYIKPSDIGLIKKDQQVRFRIDAFNYNQWGMITGSVLDISDDVLMQNQTPYFKVKCRLNQDYLQLKNGYKGYIKKGMTFSANFIVAERSLYQLLYDKADDWLNPQKGI